MEQNPNHPSADDDDPTGRAAGLPEEGDGPGEVRGFWGQHQWVPYVLPLAVFLVLGNLEPKFEVDTSPEEEVAAAAGEGVEADAEAAAAAVDGTAAEGESPGGFALPWGPEWYPAVYAVRLGLTVGCMLLVLPVYRQFPWKVSLLAFGVGAVGGGLWIGVCLLNLEELLLEPLGLGSLLGLGERAAYDPLTALENSLGLLVAFLAVRFVGLALVVPVMEEFFLRGFLMRFVIAPEWWKVRIGTRHALSLAVGTLYGVLTHPAEMIAAALWFSLITWLMLRTRNIWDCVAAHATTNLLLGIYVVTTGHWELW